MHHIIYHIARVLGLTDINGAWYALWSGIGSDLAELALIGAIFKTATKLHHQRSRHHQELMTKLTERNTE